MNNKKPKREKSPSVGAFIRNVYDEDKIMKDKNRKYDVLLPRPKSSPEVKMVKTSTDSKCENSRNGVCVFSWSSAVPYIAEA